MFFFKMQLHPFSRIEISSLKRENFPLLIGFTANETFHFFIVFPAALFQFFRIGAEKKLVSAFHVITGHILLPPLVIIVSRNL